jgi:signal transduction histidine kinase
MTRTKPRVEATTTHPHLEPLSRRARAIDRLRGMALRSLASIAVGLLLAGLYLTSLYSYLLFHTLAEMFSIAVGGALFLLVWNARRRIDNQCLLFIGLSTFFAAALDLIHTLAYSGMPIFVGYDANLPTQLWIAARYLQSLSLLLALLFIRHTVPIRLTLLAYSLITGILVISIFARVFPVCYVTGVGLTDFKKISEYVIVGILIAASWGLWRARLRFDGELVRLLIAANVLTIGAELAFTSYLSVYGPANLIGHLFKIAAFAVWYRAIVHAGILRPLDILFRNLRDSDAHLRRAESVAHFGNWELNLAERTMRASAGASAIYGLPGEEWPLADVQGVPLPEYRAMLDAALANLIEHRRPYDVEFRIRRPGDGQLRDIHSMAEYDAAQGVVFGVINDITERKRAEDKLHELNAELQTRNEELDAFAHTVAHDLKSPLGIMANYAELLLDDFGDLPEADVRQSLMAVSRSGRKAGSIIESLLMLASVRKQDVQVAPLDMAHVVDEAVLRLADSIQDSGAELSIPDRAGWPVALGYAPWIEEIWVNYLSNAIKYGGPRPHIDLGVALLPPLSETGEGQGGGSIPPLSAGDGQGGGSIPPLSAGEGQSGGFIRFSVRDYGAGLTPDQQSRLFTPFERLGQARVQGHGLGLSIVRRIAEKLGGHVGVDSQPGRGSTFYFTLPAAPDLR